MLLKMMSASERRQKGGVPKPVENAIAIKRRASKEAGKEVKSKRRKMKKDEFKSRNKPCRSEGAESKKETKNSQELEREHHDDEDENSENIQARTESAAPLEEKIDYDEETAVAVQVILEIMAQEEKGEFQLLFNDNM